MTATITTSRLVRIEHPATRIEGVGSALFSQQDSHGSTNLNDEHFIRQIPDKYFNVFITTINSIVGGPGSRKIMNA